MDNSFSNPFSKERSKNINLSHNKEFQLEFVIRVNLSWPADFCGKDNEGNILSTNREFEITESGTFSLSVSKSENQIDCSATKKFKVFESGVPIFEKVSADNYQIQLSEDSNGKYGFYSDIKSNCVNLESLYLTKIE